MLQLALRTDHLDQVPAQRGVRDRRGKRGQPPDYLGHVYVELGGVAGGAQRADVRAPGPVIDKIDLLPPGLLLDAGEHLDRQHQHLQALLLDARSNRRIENGR